MAGVVLGVSGGDGLRVSLEGDGMQDDIVFRYEYKNSDFFGYASIEIHKDGDVEVSDFDDDTVVLSQECAIAAARAILAHFGESEA